MADTPATDAPDETPDAPEEPTTPDAPATPEDAEKWKAMSRKNEAAAKKAQAELEKLRTASMSEQEKAVAEARAEGRAEAMKDANRRLLHAEVRAAAAGLLADPDDAVHLLDLEPFDTDTEPDRKAIRAALETLVKSKPYLAAGPGAGAGEGGPRGSGRTETTSDDPLARDLERMVGGPRR